MDEPGPPEEVDDDVVWVVNGERRREVERLARAVENRRRIVVVVHRLPVERRPQRRLPARQLSEAADRDLDPLGVEKGEACLELPHEVAPVFVRELDDRVGTGIAGHHLDAVGGGSVGVGAAVLEAEGDGPAASQMGGGQLAVPRRQPLREFAQVELVEVDGAEPFAHCRRTVAARCERCRCAIGLRFGKVRR